MSIPESDATVRLDGVRLARNTAFNFAGQILPLLAGVLLIPYIIRGLGPARFGMLGIIWIVFGYFSVMDFGLGRATTKFLAEWLAKGEFERVADMIWSSILLQFVFGLAGGLLLAALTPLLVERVLKTPADLMAEARLAFYILAAALPVVLTASGLRAVLEGCERFDITNLLRIPSSILAFVIPAVAVSAGEHLPGVVLWMGICRLGFTLAHGFYCFRVLPCLGTRPAFHPKTILPLLSFGGWVTASNVINPILLSMDRFLIGSLVSVAMVGYYTAPMEAVTKLWVIPASLMTTLYPASSAMGVERKEHLQILYSKAIKYIFCAIAPLSLIIALFARPIIQMWLGATFVDKSAVPLELLAVGVGINCFAHVPYAFLQALGRPDAAAKVFACELVPYGLLLWWMIGSGGISGAAAAWTLRVTIEVAVLLWVASRVLRLSARQALDRHLWVAIVALITSGVGMYGTKEVLHQSLYLEAFAISLWMIAFAFVVWRYVLDVSERTSVTRLVGFRPKPQEKILERAMAD